MFISFFFRHILVASKILFLLAIVSLSSGCSLLDKLDTLFEETVPDIATESLNTIDNAIDALDVNSAAWQSILQDTVSKLTDDAQSTLKNEVQTILDRGVATIGTEFRCNADFLGKRAKQALERIKAKLLNQPIPAIQPSICEVVPLAIDKSLVPHRVNSVSLFGYDFDTTGITATLKNGSQTLSVTQHLSKPTHYHMTINLGANGVNLTSNSDHLLLNWNNQLLSSIAVIQPSTPICKSKEVSYNRNTKLTYTPPHTRGDKEYDGHGPNIWSKVEWLNRTSRIDVSTYMKAKETKSDWTTAEGSKTITYYTPPAGWRIKRIIGSTLTTDQFQDYDHAENSRGMGPGGPVKTFIYRGDHKGSEAGSYTGMDVFFNPLQVELEEFGNCVAADAVRSLQRMQLLSPAIKTRLAPLLLNR
ncbi:MAG TPA: hypothetical protein VIM85_06095 [Pseudomonadales bacterium]